MKYIPLKNTLLEGWAKKDGKTHCLTWRAYKNTRDDGVKHGTIIEHFYCAHFVKRNQHPLSERQHRENTAILMAKADLEN